MPARPPPPLPLLLLSILTSGVTAAEPLLELQLFSKELANERGAKCLDHTPAGYYLRVQDPKKWVIFLEGGGLCIEVIDCQMRAKTDLGSSSHWSANASGDGAANLAATNPFANYSQVLVPYCSGDMWIGRNPLPRVGLLGLQMSGHLILETVVEHLLNNTVLGSASDVVLSGSSAGGSGAFHHADWLADILTAHAKAAGKAPPRFVGVPVEGVFFPEKFPVLYPDFVLGIMTPAANFMSNYVSLVEDPWVPPACEAAAKAEGFPSGECFDVSRLMHYTKTPLFICMNRFDKLMIQDLGVCLSCKGTEPANSLNGRYARYFGAVMNTTVIDIMKMLPQTGFFMPSSFHHDENFYHFFGGEEKVIAGTSLRAAFEAWYAGNNVVLLEDTCDDDGPCNTTASAQDVVVV